MRFKPMPHSGQPRRSAAQGLIIKFGQVRRLFHEQAASRNVCGSTLDVGIQLYRYLFPVSKGLRLVERNLIPNLQGFQ
jgi:hypothetical protein